MDLPQGLWNTGITETLKFWNLICFHSSKGECHQQNYMQNMQATCKGKLIKYAKRCWLSFPEALSQSENLFFNRVLLLCSLLGSSSENPQVTSSLFIAFFPWNFPLHLMGNPKFLTKVLFSLLFYILECFSLCKFLYLNFSPFRDTK